MSDTPETDKEWRHPASFDGSERVVHISVAQKRERERDEARKFLREATKQRDDALEELEVCVKERDEARDNTPWHSNGETKDEWLSRQREKYAVLERERDEAREDATNYYARIGELESERDELKKALEAAK